MKYINFIEFNNEIIYPIIKFIFFIFLYFHNPLKNKKKMLIMKSINDFLIKQNLKYIYTYHNYTSLELLELERNNLLGLLSKSIGEKITKVKYIYLGKELRFGNQILLIDKAISSCEILGCKKIILNKQNNWFIKKKISHKKYKMSFEIKNENNIEYSNVIIDKTMFFYYYYFNYFKTEHKLELIRNEIINNLPKFSINKNDLFIYIRSGDIFIRPNKYYRQSPLCFYKAILDNYEFRNVYINFPYLL